MRLDRRRFVKGAGAAGIAGIAGCSGGPSAESTATDASEEEAGEETATPAPSVGMVYATGGLGDGSFNDQAQTGIQRAAEEFGVQYQEAQPQEVADFANLQQQFAQSTNPDYELVSCIGFLQADALPENAEQYPDQSFQIVDAVVDAPNVASYVFAEEEGSYLVGQLAGLLTTRSFSAGAGSTQSDSTNVGFVGGVEGDLIRKFEAGFTAGVKAANDDVDVQTNYVGSFNDPSGGKEAALSMYDSGADVVYHASGNTGTGVFQAAQEQSRFAIGVDRDQSITKASFADVILASMVKRVDTAVFDAVEATVDGSFSGGGTTALGLAEDGVGIAYGDQLGDAVPLEIQSTVADARTSIVEGDVDVPTDPKNA